MANIRSLPPLIVKAQWNPEIKETRSVNYTDVPVGGYMAPVQVYSSGGNTNLSFQLTLDATENSRIFDVFRVDVPAIGISSVVEALKSFTYPATDSLLKFKDEDVFGEPPICYLGIGPRVMRGRVRNLSIQYTLFNSFLVPLRAVVDVEFVVDEMGVWSKVNAMYRRILAGVNPIVGGL